MDVYDLIQVLTDAGSTDDVYIVINGKRYDISRVHIDNGYVEISIVQGDNIDGPFEKKLAEERKMKTEQEQIEEMAKQMCGAIDNSCIHDCTPACGAREYAKRCFKVGYRKASEVIDEFVEQLAKKEVIGEVKKELTFVVQCEDIKKVVAEMRQEVEKCGK